MRATYSTTKINASIRLAVPNDGLLAIVIDDAVLVLDDVVSRSLGMAVSDAASASDSVAKDIGASINDASQVVDSPSVDNSTAGGAVDKNISDSAQALDSKAFSFTTGFDEQITATDSLVLQLILPLPPLQVTDFVGVADSISFVLSRAITDTAQAVDTPTLSLAGAQTDYADVTYFAEDYVGTSSATGDYADPTYFAENYTA